MSIYYRFNHGDFFEIIIQNVKNSDCEDSVQKGIMSLIIEHPFEFYQSIGNDSQRWFRFHIMDILFDLEQLPNQSISGDNFLGMSYRSNEYLDFLKYLIDIDIGFREFVDYSSLYDQKDTMGSFFTLLEKIVIKNVLKEFEKFEQEIVTKKNLKLYLEDVLTELGSMIEIKFIIMSVNKVSLYL